MVETASPPTAAAMRAVLNDLSQPPPSAFGLVWFDDIELPDEPPWRVKGVLPASGITVVFGESGSGKSFFTADLAMHIALGWPWRGLKTQQGGVLYIAAEGGGSMKKRVVAFRLANDGRIPDHVPFALIPQCVDLRSAGVDMPKLLVEIESASDQMGGVSMIIVDTLSRAFSGGNENSSEDMGAFVNNIDKLRQASGDAAIIIVHHAGKDTAKGARGHSLLRAAVDTEIEVVKNEGGSRLHGSTARITKQRDGECEGEFGFTLEQITIGTTEENDPITSCIVRLADPAPPAQPSGGQKSESKSNEAEAFLRGALSEGPRSVGEVLLDASRIGLAESTIRRAKDKIGVKANKIGEQWAWYL